MRFIKHKHKKCKRAFKCTSPFPNWAPVVGSMATDPITIRSTFIFSSNPIGHPYLAIPTWVQASLMVPKVNILDSITWIKTCPQTWLRSWQLLSMYAHIDSKLKENQDWIKSITLISYGITFNYFVISNYYEYWLVSLMSNVYVCVGALYNFTELRLVKQKTIHKTYIKSRKLIPTVGCIISVKNYHSHTFIILKVLHVLTWHPTWWRLKNSHQIQLMSWCRMHIFSSTSVTYYITINMISQRTFLVLKTEE